MAKRAPRAAKRAPRAAKSAPRAAQEPLRVAKIVGILLGLKGFEKRDVFEHIKRTNTEQTFEDNEKRMPAPLSVHSWSGFMLWCGRGAHFLNNERFHLTISTGPARNLLIFASGDMRSSRKRRSWEPWMGQKWNPRAIFLMLFYGVDFR